MGGVFTQPGSIAPKWDVRARSLPLIAIEERMPHGMSQTCPLTIDILASEPSTLRRFRIVIFLGRRRSDNDFNRHRHIFCVSNFQTSFILLPA
jgi:hypothetical protein